MVKAVVFDIGHTLVHYKNPLNWRSLYEPALKNIMQGLYLFLLIEKREVLSMVSIIE